MSPLKTFVNWTSRLQRLSDLRLAKRAVINTTLSLMIVAGVIVLVMAFAPPAVIKAEPAKDSQSVLLSSEIKIHFSHPPARREIITTISPDVAGSWQWKGSGIGGHLASELVFVPETSLLPDTAYLVSISNIRSSTGWGKSTNYSLNFRTQNLPTIVSASVDRNATQIGLIQPITVNLSTPLDKSVELSFRLEPAAEVDVATDSNRSTLIVTPKNPLEQGVTYTLFAERQLVIFSETTNEVIRRLEKEKILELPFTTVMPAEVTSFSPQGASILPNLTSIDVVFSQDMNQESVLNSITINPAIPGSWQWQGGKNLRYLVSSNLSLQTTYTIKLPASAATLAGSNLKNDASWQFTTIGNVSVLNITPSNNTTGNSIGSKVVVAFDQPVDHASAEGKFSISPAITGSFSWKNNTLTFVPSSSLDYYQTYSISLGLGIKSLYGLDSNKTFSYRFTTEEKTVLLNVKLDRQDYPLSCEIAALKMALVYKGANATENDIFSWITMDQTPHVGNTWGNPYLGFVGDVNGSQNTTGYGVYWDPIASAGSHYRTTQAFTGWSLSDLARELDAGNPIVVWGTIGTSYYDPWLTPDGKKIDAWKGEHARTVIGYRGSPTNPTAIILNDPYSASRLTWSASSFLNNWSSFNNAGVVVK